MRIIEPVDQKPIKYWDDGSIKFIHSYIWVLDGREVVVVAVFAKPWHQMVTETDADKLVDEVIKKAIYERIGEPDEFGIAKYQLINRRELEGR